MKQEDKGLTERQKNPSVFLVSNGSAIKRHSKSGRQINYLSDDDQLPYSSLNDKRFLNQIKYYVASGYLTGLYKSKYPTTKKDSLDRVNILFLWFLFHEGKALQIPSKLRNYRQMKDISERLEALGLIQLFSGFGNKNRGFSRPMAIKPSRKFYSTLEEIYT